MTWPVRHVSQSIDAPIDSVIVVAADPQQLPLWAAGLSSGIRNDDGHWITDSPMGPVEVAFVGPTATGVLDHDVTLPDGTVVHNPFRVLHNDQGSEAVFSVYQRTGMSVEEFEADVQAVTEDLARLRALVEGD